MVGWHHLLDGHEFEQAPGVGDGQGSLECCSPWGHEESDMTEQLNLTEQISTDKCIYVLLCNNCVYRYMCSCTTHRGRLFETMKLFASD